MPFAGSLIGVVSVFFKDAIFVTICALSVDAILASTGSICSLAERFYDERMHIFLELPINLNFFIF